VICQLNPDSLGAGRLLAADIAAFLGTETFPLMLFDDVANFRVARIAYDDFGIPSVSAKDIGA
jgi:hypothetical protein